MKTGVVVAALIVLAIRAAGQAPIYEHSFNSCFPDRPCTVTASFKVPDVPKNCCILTVTNGDGHGSDQVRSAEIYLNGENEALDRHAQAIVYLRKKNIVKVVLRGEPHSKVQVRIAQLNLLDSCELIEDSREHSGTFVAVKGVLYSSFEEFVLLGSECSVLPHYFGTWVLYPDELSDNPKDENTAEELRKEVRAFLSQHLTPDLEERIYTTGVSHDGDLLCARGEELHRAGVATGRVRDTRSIRGARADGRADAGRGPHRRGLHLHDGGQGDPGGRFRDTAIRDPAGRGRR